MSYGYSARLVKLNKEASRKLLGVRLGRACIANDVAVSQVAYELVVSRQTIYNWFTGATNPHADLKRAVEKFLIEQLLA
jgi:DNA-binding XRE family transcriptional regulator